MKALFAALLICLALGAPALAGSVTLQAQYGVPAGYSQQTAQQSCQAIQYIQCATIPGQILGWLGTVTVKLPQIELLSQVTCNGGVIWQGEQFQGTLVVVSPAAVPPGLAGPCAVSYEASNSGPDCLVTGSPACTGWEIQFTIFYQ